MLSKTTLPEVRRKKLKKLLNFGKTRPSRAIRLIEVHNGLSAIVASNSTFSDEINGFKEFDCLWISGLCESASRGLPDVELNGMNSRIQLIKEVIAVTDKPLLVDGDTGGSIDQLKYYIKSLEVFGVSGLVIEDKIFPKNNSLDTSKNQTLVSADSFCEKISAGKSAQITDDFTLIARTEALIAGYGVTEALSRAISYCEAGADAIIIHSRSDSPREVFEFAKLFQRETKLINRKIPLLCIPTTYNSTNEKDLYQGGFDGVIYANHLLRSALKAMELTAKSILQNNRSLESENCCTDLKDLFNLIENQNSGR